MFMWVQVQCDFRRHRKLKRLARRLNIEEILAYAHVIALWSSVTEQAPDGNLSKFFPEEIAEEAGWKGNPKEFVEAMLESGFLDKSVDGGLSIHDWSEYTGGMLELYNSRREANKARARAYRERKQGTVSTSASCARNGDVTVTPRGSDDDATDTQHDDNARVTPLSTVPDITVPDPTGPDPTVPDLTLEYLYEADEADLPARGRADALAREGDSAAASAESAAAAANTLPPEGLSRDKGGLPDISCGVQGAKPNPKPPCEGKDRATPERFMELWNEQLAPLGFPLCQSMTDKRRKAFASCVSELETRASPTWWEDYVSRISQAEFLRRAAEQNKQWLDLDWCLDEQNMVKVIEGKYEREYDSAEREAPQVKSVYERAAERNPREILAEAYPGMFGQAAESDFENGGEQKCANMIGGTFVL
jgi:hypothetical protein